MIGRINKFMFASIFFSSLQEKLRRETNKYRSQIYYVLNYK